MKSNKKFLALIPARAGSKGIKDKNIIDLKGKPLIAYSIDAALKSKYIDRVVVSTDGEDIAAVAKEWGADVPFLRPDYLASDTAKTIDAVLHCIEALKKAGLMTILFYYNQHNHYESHSILMKQLRKC